MNSMEELKRQCDTLETEINRLKIRIRKMERDPNALTKTGEIINLAPNRRYFVIGMRGQIYSLKLSFSNTDQLKYLNINRRLFLTEHEATKQQAKDWENIEQMDAIDSEAEL